MSEAGSFSVTFDVPIQIDVDADSPDEALEIALAIFADQVAIRADNNAVTVWEPRRPTVERTEEADA